MSNHAVNVPCRCLVTFRFWHAKEYENTRAASRWVPTGVTLHLSVVTHSFPFLRSVFCQVSSHIQVLAKRKSREIQTKLKVHMISDGTTLGSRFTLPESRYNHLNHQRCLCQSLWYIFSSVLSRYITVQKYVCNNWYIPHFMDSWRLIWILKLIFSYIVLFSVVHS